VDIDPAVLEVAREQFGVRESARVSLHAADGLAHLEAATQPYDVVYVDAFQKPSDATDDSGIPLRHKSAALRARCSRRTSRRCGGRSRPQFRRAGGHRCRLERRGFLGATFSGGGCDGVKQRRRFLSTGFSRGALRSGETPALPAVLPLHRFSLLAPVR